VGHLHNLHNLHKLYNLHNLHNLHNLNLGRFLRVWEHGPGGKLPQHKIYLKSRLNCVLMAGGFDPEAVRVVKEEEADGVEAGGSDGEETDIEVLESSTEDVEAVVLKEEEPEDDIWDNMVVIDHKKKRKSKEESLPSKRLK
jgi:hypothetical protein